MLVIATHTFLTVTLLLSSTLCLRLDIRSLFDIAEDVAWQRLLLPLPLQLQRTCRREGKPGCHAESHRASYTLVPTCNLL